MVILNHIYTFGYYILKTINSDYFLKVYDGSVMISESTQNHKKEPEGQITKQAVVNPQDNLSEKGLAQEAIEPIVSSLDKLGLNWQGTFALNDKQIDVGHKIAKLLVGFSYKESNELLLELRDKLRGIAIIGEV